jgi:hypothetical protein
VRPYRVSARLNGFEHSAALKGPLTPLHATAIADQTIATAQLKGRTRTGRDRSDHGTHIRAKSQWGKQRQYR